MAIYFVVHLNITDTDRFMQYFQAVMPLINQRGGRLIAHGTPEAVEGSATDQQVAIFEWSSREVFLDYWHSNEYTEVKQLREDAADFRGEIIEGVQLHTDSLAAQLQE